MDFIQVACARGLVVVYQNLYQWFPNLFMGLLSLDTWATFSVPPLEVIFTSIDLSEANLKQFYFINETKLNEPILFLYELPAL